MTGPPNDLMYAGTEPWDVDAMVLDEGHDDYFEHDNADCRDLADSLYLEGSEPLTLRITVKGSGRVTS